VLFQPGIEVGLCHGQKLKERKTAKPVIDAVRKRGLDIAEQSRTQLTIPMLKRFDEVIILAEEFEVPKVLKIQKNIRWWSSPDPDRQGPDHLEKLIIELEEKITTLIINDET